MISVCLPSDALSQHLLSYLGFSYLGQGVSFHRCPSWPRTWSSSSWPSCVCTATTPWMWGSFSWPSFLTSDVGLFLSATEVEWFYEDLQDLLELKPTKDVIFIIGDWNAKVGNQELPGETGIFCLEIQNEAGQRLIEFCQRNALVIANTLFQQHKRRQHMDITRWSTPKWFWLYYLQPKMEKLYAVSKNKSGSWLWLRSWTLYCQIQT